MTGIKGFLETSFLDWPGRSCAVLFTGGCNFRCPYCHNHPLVLTAESFPSLELNQLLDRLDPFHKWLGGICISGGEPTLDPDLPGMIQLLKSKGWAVKLDTNGSRPEVLSRLLADSLLDMIAMDVKAPLEPHKYARCAGVSVDLAKIRTSIELILNSGIDHQFRMTVLPLLHTEEDILAWAASLGEQASKKIQNFNPQATLDPALAAAKGFGPEQLAKLRRAISGPGKITG